MGGCGRWWVRVLVTIWRHALLAVHPYIEVSLTRRPRSGSAARVAARRSEPRCGRRRIRAPHHRRGAVADLCGRPATGTGEITRCRAALQRERIPALIASPLAALLIGEPFEVHMPTSVSPSIIIGVLAVAVIASIRGRCPRPDRRYPFALTPATGHMPDRPCTAAPLRLYF